MYDILTNLKKSQTLISAIMCKVLFIWNNELLMAKKTQFITEWCQFHLFMFIHIIWNNPRKQVDSGGIPGNWRILIPSLLLTTISPWTWKMIVYPYPWFRLIVIWIILPRDSHSSKYLPNTSSHIGAQSCLLVQLSRSSYMAERLGHSRHNRKQGLMDVIDACCGWP